jgi:cellulose synthase/poly-beta-1,6-N-acetylglucosamine synthase-like glycosyltransferase
MIQLASLILSVVLIQFLLILYRFNKNWVKFPIDNNLEWPTVSILVAARNEEENLPKLLESFEKINYPREKIQFLFADDQSEDETPVILKVWCESQTNASFITAKKLTDLHPVNPKAEALAQLSEVAHGEVYLFTDADCAVSGNWVKGMVSGFGPNVGMVVGVTHVYWKGFLRFFQDLDWWNTQGFMKVASDLGVSTSGMGNNMAVKKRVYDECGGFEKLKFNLTEDLEMSKAIAKAGYRVHSEIKPETLVLTKAEKSLKKLLTQRKRWMFGVLTLPWYWKVILAFQFLYFPAAIFLIFQLGWLIVPFILAKILLQAGFQRSLASRAGVKLSYFRVLSFDFYFFPTTALTILYYFWPSPIEWKSRIYP